MSESDEPVPDLAGPGMRLLLVGINPSVESGRTGLHFAHPGNRCYPALHAAGVLSAEEATAERAAAVLPERGVGISNLVPRVTARADELTSTELRAGRDRVLGRVARYRPRVVAIVGITAYRVAFDDRRAAVGRQQDGLDGTELWVVPNPSGLNAHETVESLGRAYAEVARAAGLIE